MTSSAIVAMVVWRAAETPTVTIVRSIAIDVLEMTANTVLLLRRVRIGRRSRPVHTAAIALVTASVLAVEPAASTGVILATRLSIFVPLRVVPMVEPREPIPATTAAMKRVRVRPIVSVLMDEPMVSTFAVMRQATVLPTRTIDTDVMQAVASTVRVAE